MEQTGTTTTAHINPIVPDNAIDGVPPALQLLFACGVLMLLGIVGSIALSGTIGLMCAVVVV
ncbi:hypothetical protein C6A85_10755, partial [Mycobacterium sp. ITM-2017-0098]